MAFFGRVITGIATAGGAGYLFTKYNNENSQISAKRFFATDESPKKETQSPPLNFTIQVPDPKNSNVTTRLIVITGIASALAIIC